MKSSKKLVEYFLKTDRKFIELYLYIENNKIYPYRFRKLIKSLIKEEKEHLKYWNYLSNYNYSVDIPGAENIFFDRIDNNLKSLNIFTEKIKKKKIPLGNVLNFIIKSEIDLIIGSPMYRFLFLHDVIIDKNVFNPLSNYTKHLNKIIDFALIFHSKKTQVFSSLNAIKNLNIRTLELARLNLIDILTGVKNRRYFFENFKFLSELAKRQAKNTVLLYIDVDRFKLINDTYGHDFGDIVLKKTAHMLEKNLRKSDILSRIGGDEFAVGMIGDNYEEVINRIRDNFRNFKIVRENKKININVSIGVALHNPKKRKTNIFKLLNEADKDMYRNKLSKKF